MLDSIITPVSPGNDVLRLSVHPAGLQWDVNIGLERDWWARAPQTERARVLRAVIRALDVFARQHVEGHAASEMGRIITADGGKM